MVRTQLETLRQFLDHRARQRAGQRRIIPAREPGIDIADIAAHAPAASPPSRRSTAFGYSVVCLLPEKRSSSLLTISRGPCACVTSTSASAGIMRAGSAEAGEIDRLAARELVAHMRDPRIGEFRAELVKSRSPHGFRRQPARDAEAGGGEPWMSRTNSYVWFQPVQPLGLASCTHGNDANLHQSQLAPGNNAVSSYGISTCLQALMRLARLGRNKTEKIKGRKRCRFVCKTWWP